MEYLLCLLVGGVVFFGIFRAERKRANIIESRIAFIGKYVFPSSVKEKFKRRHPKLDEKAVEAVFIALKDFFIFCTDGEWHSMPSKVVDDAWHEFILHTKEYHGFCDGAFGKFLHHSPTETFEKLQSTRKQRNGLKTVWTAACLHENIDRKLPQKLPRLFVIDKLLDIEGGNFYSHLEHPLSGEVSAYDIKCSSEGGRGFSGCGGGCGGE